MEARWTLSLAQYAKNNQSRETSRFPTNFQQEREHMFRLRGLIAGCMVAAALALTPAGSADAGFGCNSCCAPAPVCCPCPPPPVRVDWCVKDPCTCCTYQVSACVPACCAGVEPCYVGCRSGFLGRKILTYKFPCCDHCVEVVITKFGRTIVR